MDRTESLGTVQEYISDPGSSMTLILSFSESQIEAEISVMKPTVISRESSTPEDPSNMYAPLIGPIFLEKSKCPQDFQTTGSCAGQNTQG